MNFLELSEKTSERPFVGWNGPDRVYALCRNLYHSEIKHFSMEEACQFWSRKKIVLECLGGIGLGVKVRKNEKKTGYSIKNEES